MKSYLKFLSRNALYTAIEAVGLAVSLAFVIIIGTSVYDQVRLGRKGAESRYQYLVSDPGAPGMEYRETEQLKAFPEIKKLAAFVRTEISLNAGAEKRRSVVLFADPELLEMIPLNVRDGSMDLFRQGTGLVITHSAARKYFPGINPVGEVVTLGREGYELYGEKGKDELPVVAVVDDPTYSSLDDFEVLCPFQANSMAAKTIRESDMHTGGMGYIVYVLAQVFPGTDVEDLSRKYGKINGFGDGPMTLTPLRSLYFSDVRAEGLRQGRRLYLQVLLILGILLLLSSILNYVNLSSALSGNRAKEMASRRLVGAGSKDVFWKTILESVLFTLVCYGLAILIAVALVPGLNSIRPTEMSVPFRVSASPFFIGLSIVLIVLVGLAAGIFPALLSASYRPIDVVSGQVRRRRKMTFNKICIIVQAVLAVVLVCVSLTLEAQLRFLEKMDLGTDPASDLFYFHPQQYSSKDIRLLGDQLAQAPGVLTICYADGIPSHVRSLTMGKENRMLSYISCDSLAFRLLGFRVKETFEPLHSGTFWIPESLKEDMGITAENADISEVLPRRSMASSIGGVIEDSRRIADNGFDPIASLVSEYTVFPPSVMITPNDLSGILIRTTEDHDAFRKMFVETATAVFRDKSEEVIPYFENGDYAQCGYLEDIIAADYEDLRRYVRVIEVFTLIALLLAMLGLLAICTWYASTNSKDIAIRKVFGGTVKGESVRTILRYMSYVLLAVAIGIPISILLSGRLLERWPDRISGYWWIFVVSALFVFIVSALAILWQTIKAAKTNPAAELKKE